MPWPRDRRGTDRRQPRMRDVVVGRCMVVEWVRCSKCTLTTLTTYVLSLEFWQKSEKCSFKTFRLCECQNILFLYNDKSQISRIFGFGPKLNTLAPWFDMPQSYWMTGFVCLNPGHERILQIQNQKHHEVQRKASDLNPKFCGLSWKPLTLRMFWSGQRFWAKLFEHHLCRRGWHMHIRAYGSQAGWSDKQQPPYGQRVLSKSSGLHQFWCSTLLTKYTWSKVAWTRF